MKRIFGLITGRDKDQASGRSPSGGSGRSSRQSGGSGRSSSSGSNKADETKAPPTDAMSTTARLILDTLEKMSTPLKDSDKVPTLSVDRKRVAEELNQSLGLTGSARKRPRLGTGPMQSTSSPLGGPPFRKLYSPLSAHRSRPPRVKHITPMASLNDSRPATPLTLLAAGLLDSSSTVPPPPPNVSLTAFSTPLSSLGGDGGGKLRNKITGRGADMLYDEEPAPPLPAFLTNNVPQLKVSTPLTGFSFSTSSSTTPTASYNNASVATENYNTGVKSTITTNVNSSENKSMPPIFGLTQPLTTVAASTDLKTAAPLLPSFGSQKSADNDKVEGNKMFSFSSPVQTILHKKDSGIVSTGLTAGNKELAENSIMTTGKSSVSSAFTNGFDTSIARDIKVAKNTLSNHNHEEKSSASKKAESGVIVPMTNGGYDPRMKEFTFEAPSSVVSVAESKSIMDKKCSMNFIFTPPKPVGKGK